MSRFSRKTDPKALSREASLASKPIRNPALTCERHGDGGLLLRVPYTPPRSRWARLVARALRLEGTERRISLDEIGTYVWDMCDGETTVRKMIGRFAEEYKLNRKEAEVSMVQYLRTLAKRGLVGIMVPEDAVKKAER